MCFSECQSVVFFFNDTATTEIYTLSLHDALPIFDCVTTVGPCEHVQRPECKTRDEPGVEPLDLACRTRRGDRKSTRLNSSHLVISYAVFCLKKKKKFFDKLACSP